MEDPKENKNSPWLSVPQFGDWDQKGGSIPDYSMDFSKIREMRKQNKRDPSRASLGNEEELINPFHNQPSSVDNNKPNKLTTVHSDNNKTHDEFSHHQPLSPSMCVFIRCGPYLLVDRRGEESSAASTAALKLEEMKNGNVATYYCGSRALNQRLVHFCFTDV
ncbi:hypothetical protein F2Q70_00000624 [Brassica cretica]|uniref:RIN4 pathogenic type III effector avirulence factor Avr cleavage site domain-containing protein n=1 Tax=Brassica cretica TaxID=69181 RepID=A0A8S9IVZ6_BRACR|nr:hypothetical protein F2Q70_00000624 [Brassica cretica]